MKYKLGYIIGVLLVCVFLLFKVKAEDGGTEFELGDLGVGIGVAAFVLFGATASLGFIIFLNSKKVFGGFINVKIFYKIHHPLSLVTAIFFGIHVYIAISSGSGAFGNPWAIAGYLPLFALGALVISGFLFRKVKGTKREILRYIHLALMTFIVVSLAFHSAMFG